MKRLKKFYKNGKTRFYAVFIHVPGKSLHLDYVEAIVQRGVRPEPDIRDDRVVVGFATRRQRERERRGGGGYVSPFIGSAASTHAATNGQSGYKYSGVSAGAPSRVAPSSVSSGGRSSSSGTALSSGARGSASVSS